MSTIIKLPQRLLLLMIPLVMVWTSCDDIIRDDQVPVIQMDDSTHFPVNCGEVYRGESFTIRATLTDNIELGSYSIEIHHNFDHHSHSTSATQCAMEEKKAAIKPFLLIEQFDIPAGNTTYEVRKDVFIPADVDTGDYHLTIRLTDKSGWQTFKGISIRIKDAAP